MKNHAAQESLPSLPVLRSLRFADRWKPAGGHHYAAWFVIVCTMGKNIIRCSRRAADDQHNAPV